jgi:hypothetical protein
MCVGPEGCRRVCVEYSRHMIAHYLPTVNRYRCVLGPKLEWGSFEASDINPPQKQILPKSVIPSRLPRTPRGSSLEDEPLRRAWGLENRSIDERTQYSLPWSSFRLWISVQPCPSGGWGSEGIITTDGSLASDFALFWKTRRSISPGSPATTWLLGSHRNPSGASAGRRSIAKPTASDRSNDAGTLTISLFGKILRSSGSIPGKSRK